MTDLSSILISIIMLSTFRNLYIEETRGGYDLEVNSNDLFVVSRSDMVLCSCSSSVLGVSVETGEQVSVTEHP